jgi:hypothetical protein
MKSEYLVPVPDETMIRVKIFDWYEKETSGPSIGAIRPPAYGFKGSEGLYVIYPVLIQELSGRAGPPIFPLLNAMSLEEASGAVEPTIEVRYISNDKGDNPPISTMLLDTTQKKERFFPKEEDSVGTVYSAGILGLTDKKNLEVEIVLTDQSRYTVRFERRVISFYSPIMSFNGPDPKEEYSVVKIKEPRFSVLRDIIVWIFFIPFAAGFWILIAIPVIGVLKRYYLWRRKLNC